MFRLGKRKLHGSMYHSSRSLVGWLMITFCLICKLPGSYVPQVWALCITQILGNCRTLSRATQGKPFQVSASARQDPGILGSTLTPVLRRKLSADFIWLVAVLATTWFFDHRPRLRSLQIDFAACCFSATIDTRTESLPPSALSRPFFLCPANYSQTLARSFENSVLVTTRP